VRYGRRCETGPWFAVGSKLDGEAVYGRLREDRAGEGWLRPYCIYVHVPFCTSICSYCALYTSALPDDAGAALDEYVSAVGTALESHPWSGHPHAPTTVHFGGGTPLSVGVPRFSALVGAIRRAFGSSPGCEWAVETTVSSLDEATIDALASLGFRRIHLGIQTLDDDIRHRIGRRGTSTTAIRLIRDLLERGFFPSVDLIIGFAGAGRAVVQTDLRGLHDAGIRMFSICDLRERALSRLDQPEVAARERDNRDAWAAVWDFMSEAGLRQIHLGQFGRDQDDNRYYTHPARHENCVAIGPYAHGSAGDAYYGNLLLPEYCAALRSGRSPVAHGVVYGDAERPIRELERCLLADRIPRSVLAEVADTYSDEFPGVLDSWIAGGLLVPSPDREVLVLSRDGSWFVGNMIEHARSLHHALREARREVACQA
jgi:anaerobilin synthase